MIFISVLSVQQTREYAMKSSSERIKLNKVHFIAIVLNCSHMTYFYPSGAQAYMDFCLVICGIVFQITNPQLRVQLPKPLHAFNNLLPFQLMYKAPIIQFRLHFLLICTVYSSKQTHLTLSQFYIGFVNPFPVDTSYSLNYPWDGRCW